MARITFSQSSLLGGVSQQPEILRLPNQCEEQINFVPSPVDGLYRRNGMQHVATMDTGLPPNTGPARVFPIVRDNDERYILVAQGDKLRVFGLDGQEFPIYGAEWTGGTPVDPNWLYIDGTDPNKLKVLNVADYTFILNPERLVPSLIGAPLEPQDDFIAHAYVSFIQGQYDTTYTLEIQTENSTYPTQSFSVRTFKDPDKTASDSQVPVETVGFPKDGDIGNITSIWQFTYTKQDTTTATVQVSVKPALGSFANKAWMTLKALKSAFEADPLLRVSGFKYTGGLVQFTVKGYNKEQMTNGNPWALNIQRTLQPPSAADDFVINQIQIGEQESVKSLKTVDIAAAMADEINTYSPVYTAENIGHVLRITGPVYITGLVAEDDHAGTLMLTCNRAVANFDELPTRCYHNYHVRVQGKNQDDDDDYWVRFVLEDNFEEELDGSGKGFWEESIPKWPFGVVGNSVGLFAANMPHQLVRRDLGGIIYFTFEEPAWENRQVGDIITNPEPGFVGGPIDDIVFHRNRLGLIARERIIFSESGNYFNFWRTTVRQLLDSDPVDIASNLRGVINFDHAAEIDGDLLLLSDQVQCRLEAEPLLTPTTATIRSMLRLQVDTQRGPEVVGRGAMVPFLRGDWAGIHEIYRSDEVNYDYHDVTEQVPHYLNGQVVDIAASPRDNVVVVLTTGGLYLYNFFIRGREKLQSAWSKMEVSGEVLGVAFFDSDLYLTVRDTVQVNLYKIPFESNYRDPTLGWDPRLDRRISWPVGNGTYDPDDDTTAITLPFYCDLTEESDSWYVVNTDTGEIAKAVADFSDPSAPLLTVTGNWTTVPYVTGKTFTSTYSLSRIMVRESDGERVQGVSQGRTQLLIGKMLFRNSGYAYVEVNHGFGSVDAYTFTGPGLGTGSLLTDYPTVQDDEFEFPIYGDAEIVRVSLSSSSCLPLALVGTEWTVDFSTRATRYRG